MTLQQMNYLLTIAESGSMNKTTEKLFISQPTLTSVIRDVESEIGIIFICEINQKMIGNFVDIIILIK